jgi:twitching motility protein PilT
VLRYDQESVRKMLQDASDAGATDIHLKVPARPRFRVAGQLVNTPYPPLTPDDTRRIAQELLTLARTELPLNTLTERELSFGVHRIGRFRAYLYKQRGSLGIVIHRMALSVPTLKDLGGSPELGDRVWAQPGLVMVTGQRNRLGLMAALLQHFNRYGRGYLLSLEHPLEYLHADGNCAVAQREVPHDTPSFAEGLQWALTGDCDAVMSLDLPDAATAELAMRVAENGRHMVASVIGCPAEEVGRWLVQMFPPHRSVEITSRLRRVLRLAVFERDGRVDFIEPGQIPFD